MCVTAQPQHTHRGAEFNAFIPSEQFNFSQTNIEYSVEKLKLEEEYRKT